MAVDSQTKNKVFLFGIDGAAPELLFDTWLSDLPTIRSLVERGCHAKLNSTIPPITIAAWNAMLSGKEVSQLGVFGYSYKNASGETKIADSSLIKTELLWDYLGHENKKTIALYVPLSYPAKPINGIMVTDFLTPGVNSNCTYPEQIKEKIKTLGNTECFFDVAVGLAGHKGLEVGVLIEKTYEMTKMQLALLNDLITTHDWDVCVAVMIGSDRLQHMLWNHFDPKHRKFIKNSPHANALKEYYIYLDTELGKILKQLDDNTTIIVASDHGMVRQEGKININNWLMQEGYLVLKDGVPSKKTRFSTALVDMEKSIAYGSGAYHARVFINKEKVGKDYEKIRQELTHKLKAIPDDSGKPIKTVVFRKEDIYEKLDDRECPDLTIYFDDLRWASNPDLGQESIYSWETALGADTAGHSRQGSFIIAGKNIKHEKNIGELDICQVAPTILKALNSKSQHGIKVKHAEVFTNEYANE